MEDHTFATELAGVIKDASRKEAGDAVRFSVLGTLDGEMRLLPDGFGRPIPAADYHKLKGLSFSPGNRVICLPIEDGHTFVLLGEVDS